MTHSKIKRKIRRYHLVGVLLALILVAIIVIGIYPSLTKNEAGNLDMPAGNFDVSYVWTPDLGRALDYLRELGEVLEPEILRKLRVVKRQSDDGDYGIIYDLNGDRDSVLSIAEKHSEILQSADLNSASVIEDEGYYKLYNISYGVDPDLEIQKSNYRKAAQILGPVVTRDLVIENVSDDYAVVYKSLSDIETVTGIAGKHAELLKSEGLTATVVMETNNDVIYGESSYLDELLENESLYNVSYGLGPNLEAQKANHAKISQVLGEEVARNLVIRETPYKNYLLVYVIRKDEKSTRDIARKHKRLLRSKRISAAIIRESDGNNVVYGGSYGVEDLLKVKRETTPAPEAEDLPEVEAEEEEEPELTPPEEPSVQQPIQDYISAPETEAEELPEVETEEEGPSLQQQIQDYISDLRNSKKLSLTDKVACSVFDFTTGEKLVSINENEPLQAASMIKPFVALAFFHEAEKGRFIYGSKTRARMRSMIQRSRNSSTNWVMRQVGGPHKVQEILQDNYSMLFTGTSIKEYIPSRGRTYINKASALDYGRFLYAMWHGQLPYSRELRRLMALPNSDRVCHGTREVPKGTLVYDKTGSTSRLIGNMAILVAQGKNGKKYPYTLICVIERRTTAPNYTAWSRRAGDIIREVSNRVYIVMKKKHNLV
jgi:beta-lactamase class A